jgi:DNA-binding beta-propeller fold protein YncE
MKFIYWLRVIDVRDLNNPRNVNDLPCSSSLSEPKNPPFKVVSAADGRVYTLDPIQKNVIIWKTDINMRKVDPFLPVGDPESPKYTEFKTGDDPRDIAVSPDGAWLFIAEAADADNCIQVAKVETLTPAAATPQVTRISVPDKPLLLAVSSKQSARLYVVTADRKVRTFHIQETPSLFPEIGTGVDVGPDEPVTITASPSGKWAYVLVKDSSGKGWVRVVDWEKFETDPAHAVSDPVAVVSGPQDILLAPDGRRLYAAGDGAEQLSGGGVSVNVINLREKILEIFENM